MPTSVNRISTAADVNFQASPANGQVLQYDGSSAKWSNKILNLGGFTPTAKTANYTAVAGDHVFANAASGAITITLPSASSAGNGGLVRVTKSDTTTNGVIVKAPSGNLNGVSTTGTLTNTSSKTANYTAVSLDNVLCNASAGGFTVTLPAPANNAWVRVTKTDTSVNGVLVLPPSGTIDNDAAAVVNRSFRGQNFVGDGSAWHYIPDTDSSTYRGLTTQDFVSDGTTWWTV